MMRSTILNAALQGEKANLLYLVEKHPGSLIILNEQGETVAEEYMRLRPGPQERRTAMLLAPPFVLPWLLPEWFLDVGGWDDIGIDWTL
jgi:hypothetical protein